MSRADSRQTTEPEPEPSQHQAVPSPKSQQHAPERFAFDLESLDRDPIHLYDYIQPHGVLLALAEPELTILQASENTVELLGVPAQELLGQPLKTLLSKSQIARLRKIVANGNFAVLNLVKFRLKQPDKTLLLDGIVHRNGDGILILELGPTDPQDNINFLDFYYLVRASATKLQKTSSLHEMCQMMAEEMKTLTGFDRVMVYKFHNDWHGHVIAEARENTLEPFLDLHFPDADTRQCRSLFGLNWNRSIVDVNSQSVSLLPKANPMSEQPLDLSLSVLRGISLCHQKYLQNMGVQASLVMSLTREQTLWGLISCHHRSPKQIPYEVQQACEFLGQVMSLELSTKENNEDYEYRVELQSIQTQLIEFMATADSAIEGLVKHKPNVLDLVSAQGAVVCLEGKAALVGKTPEGEDLRQLLAWIEETVEEEVFATDSLPALYPEAEHFKVAASGLLAISISKTLKNYILWFRPEFVQTVRWAGNPSQAVQTVETEEGIVRLTPRGSFAEWKETVRSKSLPWVACEIEAAQGLRSAIVNIVLRQAEELAKLAQDLERSNAELEKFAYVASHDLQEPLNLVSSYVQLLEMRYQDRLDQDAREFIGFAVEGVNHMQTLIDDLLAYSRVGSRGKAFEPVELEAVLQRACKNVQQRIGESRAGVTYDALPAVMGDRTQLVQLFQNFISNAIKFRSDQPPAIHIGVQQQTETWLFSVRDNGIGIEPEFAERIFVIFQRLHARDEYPGTGIGLAICKKIVERHGGRIWVESKLGQGATFYFTLPVRELK